MRALWSVAVGHGLLYVCTCVGERIGRNWLVARSLLAGLSRIGGGEDSSFGVARWRCYGFLEDLSYDSNVQEDLVIFGEALRTSSAVSWCELEWCGWLVKCRRTGLSWLIGDSQFKLFRDGDSSGDGQARPVTDRIVGLDL